MASRTVWVGDNAPDDLFQITDETFEETIGTVLNLTGDTINVQYIGANFEFDGAGASIWPATADPDGTHFWNCSYTFGDTDTAHADTYAIFVTVTSGDDITTYATGDTLIVKAFPVPA